jgi:ABC-type dipeptide/oligopeptide/nickel transport system permease subunit
MPSAAVGLALLGGMLLLALVGPLIAPYDPTTPIGPPGDPPSTAALLGTDVLGRDVLSRALHGGLTVIALGTLATVLSYLAGSAVGLVAGYVRNLVDPLLMRAVDVLLSLPGLLIMLLLVSGLGSGVPVLVLGVVLVQLPGIARVVRTATLEASVRSYVEAALARGEGTASILLREIFPNVAPLLLADVGVRFGWSIILIASMNFLGLGLAPPTADWSLMVSENRAYVSLNIWSVLAPALLLALLMVAINLVVDAYARSLGRSLVQAPATGVGAQTAPSELTESAVR